MSRTQAPAATAPTLTGADPTMQPADHALQRRDRARADKQPDDATRYAEASSTVHVMADIVQRKSKAMVPSAPQPQQRSLLMLYDNVVGVSLGSKLSGTTRLSGLEMALEDLDADMREVESDPQGRQYVADEIDAHLTDLRKELRFYEARERSDRAVRVGNQTVEVSEMPTAHEEARILHLKMPGLLAGVTKANELLAGFKHHEIEHAAKAVFKGHEPHGGTNFAKLEELQHLLMVVDGMLKLTDEELLEKLRTLDGDTFQNIATFGEFVGAVTEIVGGVIGLVASSISIAAYLGGATSISQAASAIAQGVGTLLSDTLACVEIVVGLAEALSPNATKSEQVDGVFKAAMGFGWLAGGTPGTVAVVFGYLEYVVVVNAFFNAAFALDTGMMRPGLEYLQRKAGSIARSADRLANSRAIAATETDQDRRAALEAVHRVELKNLADEIADLIEKSKPQTSEVDLKRPGSYQILHEILRPLSAYSGKTTADDLLAAAQMALQLIAYAVANTEMIILHTTQGHDLTEMQDDITERRAKARKAHEESAKETGE